MTFGFVLLGIHWLVLAGIALWQLRPTGLLGGDYVVIALAVAVCGFYVWVAREVYARRRSIWNIAFGCAAIWLLGFPTGTITAVVLVATLLSSRHHFTH